MNTSDMTTFCVLFDVHAERRRQDALRKEGRFAYTLANRGMLDAAKLCALAEEVGEAARCVLAMSALVQEDLGAADLRKELVQVAALAVAWCESLDAEAAADTEAGA